LSFLFIEGAGVLLENPLIKGFIGSKWVKSVSRLESQIKGFLIKKSKIGVSFGKDEPIVLFRTGDITDYYTEEELGRILLIS
jgi:phosphate transport system permease protein